jgi:cyanophycin synthetase
VLLDYAHNAHGMEAMAKTVRGLTVNGRRIGIVSAPGDRRDDDIRALGRASAPAFDLVILREDDNRRGRTTGVVGELLREGLLAAGFPEDRIAPGVLDEEEAVRRGLETARPGDLLVIFGDDLPRDWEQIVSFGKPAGSDVPPGVGAPAAPVFSPETRPWQVGAADAPGMPGEDD